MPFELLKMAAGRTVQEWLTHAYTLYFIMDNTGRMPMFLVRLAFIANAAAALAVMPASAQEPVKIGVLLSMSGTFASPSKDMHYGLVCLPSSSATIAWVAGRST
jgi:hypothetical protein